MAKNKKKGSKPKINGTDSNGIIADKNLGEKTPDSVPTTDIDQDDLAEDVAVKVTTPETSTTDTIETIESDSIEVLQQQVETLTLQNQKSSNEYEVKLNQITTERDETKAAYDNLLSKLLGMKSLFAKMKESQQELEETKETLQSLTEENESLSKENKKLSQELKNVQSNNDQASAQSIKELTTKNELLNSECEKLSTSLTTSNKQFQSQIDELQDEKYNLENLNNKHQKVIHDLKSQIQTFSIESQEHDLNSQNLQLKIDELNEEIVQKQLEINQLQKANESLVNQQSQDQQSFAKQKQELQDLFNKQDEDIVQLNQDKTALKQELASTITKLEDSNEQIKQIDELKSEINVKQLLIGKLRHEAIILNEHLTKSLTMLKQHTGEGSNTIDKVLISNVILQFLQFPRGDSKKFEALQLISALLEWNDEMKVSAGLSHNQMPNGTVSKDRQSFVNLWTDFLEKESTKK